MLAGSHLQGLVQPPVPAGLLPTLQIFLPKLCNSPRAVILPHTWVICPGQHHPPGEVFPNVQVESTKLDAAAPRLTVCQ